LFKGLREQGQCRCSHSWCQPQSAFNPDRTFLSMSLGMKQYPEKRDQALSALGFDFGTKRIGVAYGQSLTGTAQAVATLPAHDGVPDWQVLTSLVESWKPDVFVVGLPWNMDGTESDLLLRAR